MTYIGIGAIKARAMRAVTLGTMAAAEQVKRDAEPLIPVESGLSRESLRRDPPVRKGNRVSVDVEVGGAQVWYAPIVHQRTDVKHVVGRSKFLETPLLQNVPVAREAVRRAGQREF